MVGQSKICAWVKSASAPIIVVYARYEPPKPPIPPSQMLVLLLEWKEFPLRGLTHGKAVGRSSKV